mmetsp:Transcript_17327/g.19576  ORF Transcript_17327/g.19576 Transcript_17327/m.19576 type:complete len:201 (+) Transcript_17327:645-1247(+)
MMGMKKILIQTGIRQGLELYQKYKHVDPSPLASIILQEKEGTSTSPSTTTTTTELPVGGKSDDQKMPTTSQQTMSTSSSSPPQIPVGSGGILRVKRPPKNLFGDTGEMTLFQGLRLSQSNDAVHVNKTALFCPVGALRGVCVETGCSYQRQEGGGSTVCSLWCTHETGTGTRKDGSLLSEKYPRFISGRMYVAENTLPFV